VIHGIAALIRTRKKKSMRKWLNFDGEPRQMKEFYKRGGGIGYGNPPRARKEEGWMMGHGFTRI